MGFWMTLSRHHAAQVEALLEHPDGAQAGRKRLWDAWTEAPRPDEPHDSVPLLEFLEENDDIRRNWDGLHVMLTGCTNHADHEDREPCGRAPARDAVMGGLALPRGGRTGRIDDARLLMPDEVRAVHDFLQDLDIPRLVQERATLVEEADVYSFRMGVGLADGSTRNMSMIEDGSLADSLRNVRDFYARAAADGNAVIKEIS
ncbi:YfbM family protein [Streptomyces sp. N2-109]|uniref:YfbM family protein n=1 Tax=Streptomyces gossypii TaxID=2883101 RepID=A0ABT2JPI3_9ACTN|nr:YfbM family protein [Streptomyces gossypii]MCT2589792.1 YfbM family protein [Streptomyces gossypii]